MPITSTPSDSSDYYGSQSSSTATVDKYGIPINHNNSNGSNSSNNSIPKQQIRPVRRGRRPSMPTYLATNNSTANNSTNSGLHRYSRTVYDKSESASHMLGLDLGRVVVQQMQHKCQLEEQ